MTKPSWRLLLLALVASAAPAAEIDVWIGTATPDDNRGVYHTTLDSETGQIAPAKRLATIRQPGFLALHPGLPVLYTTGSADDGEPSVSAYGIHRGPGGTSLKPLGHVPTGAGSAAHLSADKTGRVLLAAFYGTGRVAAFPLEQDGSIGPRAALINHTGGSGVVEGRQDGPHPHWAGVSPDNRFAFVPDLGTDKVHHYRLDAGSALLTATGATSMPPGGGPRHLTFHPNGKWAYVVNELALSLSVLRYNAEKGGFTPLQTIPTLSAEQRAGETFNSGSEVQAHPSGRFVYSGNRGHDTISVFAVDGQTGKLSLVEQEPIRGAWPRHFALTPGGEWLLAAGAHSNSLAVFRVSPDDGRLQYTQQRTWAPAPICVLTQRNK